MAKESLFDIIAKGATSYLKAKSTQDKAKIDMQSKIALKQIEQQQSYLYKIAEKEHMGPYERRLMEEYGQQQGAGVAEGELPTGDTFAPGQAQRRRIELGPTGPKTKTIGMKEAIYGNIMRKPEEQRTEKERKFAESYLGIKKEKPTSVDRILGALEAGGAVDKQTGIMISEFENRDEAETYALYNLGPDWKTRFPRALDIVNTRWPSAQEGIVEGEKPPVEQRFNELVGELESEEAAYRKLAEEGY